MRKLRKVALAIIVSILMTGDSWAVGSAGIGNEVPDARAAGQGYVGVAAQNDVPTVVYSNPAGLTKLRGTNATLGVTYENLHGVHTTTAGVKEKMRSVDIAVPNISLSHRLMDGKLGIGIGSVSPYGIESHWRPDSSVRFVATNSRLRMIDLTPAVAYEVMPGISFGVGADYINVFDTSLEKQVSVDAVNTSLGAPTLGSPEGVSKLSGSGETLGYHLGALYEPNERHAFGVVYHSQTKVEVNGKVELHNLSGATAALFGGTDFNSSAYTEVFFPQNIQAGYAYKPTDRLMLEVDGAWYNWSVFRELNIRYPDVTATQRAILTNSGAGNPTPLQFVDSFNIATGANYKLSDAWQVRGGFWYLPSVTPENTFTPSILDLARYGLSTGFGYTVGPVTIDFSYNAVFFHNRQITNSVGLNSTGLAAADISGSYGNFTHLVALNATYRFGAR